MISRSKHLDHVHSDIRGPLYQEALRMEAAGTHILKLNTGNPARFGFELPPSVREALIAQVDRAVPYCDVRGMIEARDSICAYHVSRGLQGITPDDVFICNGVSEAASMLVSALIGAGDEILLPSPCYSLWSNNAYLCGGVPRFSRCDPENDWNPDPDDIRSKVSDRTKAILIINPNNPTGVVYSHEILMEIAEIARQNHLVLLADEIYDRLVMDGLPHESIAALAPGKYAVLKRFALRQGGFHMRDDLLIRRADDHFHVCHVAAIHNVFFHQLIGRRDRDRAKLMQRNDRKPELIIAPQDQHHIVAAPDPERLEKACGFI